MSEPLEPRPTTDGASAGAGVGGENPNGGAQAMMMTNGAIGLLAILAYFLCREGREIPFALAILIIVALALANLAILKKVQAAIRRLVAACSPEATGKRSAYGRR